MKPAATNPKGSNSFNPFRFSVVYTVSIVKMKINDLILKIFALERGGTGFE